MSRMRSAFWCLGLTLGVGCSDDSGATDPDDGSSGAPTSTAADGSTTENETDEPTTGPDSSGDTEPGAPIEVQAYTYPNQPMVVDLAFSAPALDVTVTHTGDPGVRTGPLPEADGQTWVRVRGLAPATEHTLAWSASAGDDPPQDGTLTFDTEAALPGFVPSFPLLARGPNFGGYVLFDRMNVTTAESSLQMVDGDGTTRWHIGRQDGVFGPNAVFASGYLYDDGSLLFLRNLAVQVVDELGTPLLSVDSKQLGVPGLHHDVVPLDNGNFLSMSFTFRDVDYPDLGLTHVAGDLLVEFDADGNIVWEWDAFDHLDPQRRREGFEILIPNPETGQNGQDWTHGNGLVYEPETDSVLFSIRHQDWLVRVDRKTGDVVWRLGPEGDFALDEGDWFYHQHSPQWQDDGTLLLYDNGLANPDLDDDLERSRTVRYAVDTDTMTATQVWTDAPQDFIAPVAGDADRLPNGNLLITDSSIDMAIGEIHAVVREVDESTPADPVWSLQTQIGTFIYRCSATLRLVGEAE